MTCPGCDRDRVELIGGYCGHCSSEIASAFSDALEEVDALDGEIVDVFKGGDGYVRVRIDPRPVETDGGEDERGITAEDLDECWCCGSLHDSFKALCPSCDDAGCTHFGGECQSDHKPVRPDGGTVETGECRVCGRTVPLDGEEAMERFGSPLCRNCTDEPVIFEAECTNQICTWSYRREGDEFDRGHVEQLVRNQANTHQKTKRVFDDDPTHPTEVQEVEPVTDGGQATTVSDREIRPGQTWTMDESRADPADVPDPHDVELWAAQPSFHAVVDDILDGLVELTVATGNDHPRTPDLGETVDVAADRLREDPRWRVRR